MDRAIILGNNLFVYIPGKPRQRPVIFLCKKNLVRAHQGLTLDAVVHVEAIAFVAEAEVESSHSGGQLGGEVHGLGLCDVSAGTGGECVVCAWEGELAQQQAAVQVVHPARKLRSRRCKHAGVVAVAGVCGDGGVFTWWSRF